MKVTSVHKGHTMKTVSIEAPEDADTNALTDLALTAAGETRTSVMGWSVNYWPVSENWTVDINID